MCKYITLYKTLRGLICLLIALVMIAPIVSYATHHTHTTKTFTGSKVNAGKVTHSKMDGKNVLTLSDDFVVPNTPDPHWQVVDSKGNVYLLQRLDIKGGKVNKSITLPSYIPDVAKVQVWCAWAETLLGEAPFESPVS